MCDQRSGRVAGILVMLALALPFTVLAETPAARKPYREQWLRHQEIRSRAEEVGKHPLLSRYDIKVAEARIDDDREMKTFDRQASTPAGSAVAAPKLKLYNDSLQKTLERMLEYVRR